MVSGHQIGLSHDQQDLPPRIMGLFSCSMALGNPTTKLQPHGCYSTQRLRRLKQYTETRTLWRLLAVCLLSPIPCVALATLIESIPLTSPFAGPYKNFTFWVRATIVTYFVDYSVLVQMSQSLSRLKMEHRHIVTIALVGSIFSFFTVFAVAVWVAFPVPFSMLVASPPSTLVVLIGFKYAWGLRWSADAGLQRDLVRHMMVFVWQVMLTFIYPLYIFGFTSLSGVGQTLFVIVLPAIKAVGESWIGYTLGDDNDIKPEVIIFNVEVFNALYVSCAVQNSTSPATTIALMLEDVLHFWFCMTGVMGIVREAKELMVRIPPDHPQASAGFVEIALQLLEIEDRAESGTSIHSQTTRSLLPAKSMKEVDALGVRTQGAVPSANLFDSQIFRKIMPTTQVYPLSSTARTTSSAVSVRPGPGNGLKPAGPHQGLGTLFTRKERAKFISTTTRVLFITEYLILVEYTEAVLPMVYALFLVIAFHLPNKSYIQTFDGLSSEQLYTNTGYVLVYSFLELTSLVVALAVLRRTLGTSSLHQLGFVLETQASMIQSKLMLWFVYVMQVPIVHVEILSRGWKRLKHADPSLLGPSIQYLSQYMSTADEEDEKAAIVACVAPKRIKWLRDQVESLEKPFTWEMREAEFPDNDDIQSFLRGAEVSMEIKGGKKQFTDLQNAKQYAANWAKKQTKCSFEAEGHDTNGVAFVTISKTRDWFLKQQSNLVLYKKELRRLADRFNKASGDGAEKKRARLD